MISPLENCLLFAPKTAVARVGPEEYFDTYGDMRALNLFICSNPTCILSCKNYEKCHLVPSNIQSRYDGLVICSQHIKF